MALSRATLPCPTAAARVAESPSATPTSVRPTTVVAPIAPVAATPPIGACAEARPRRSTSSGSSSGRRKTSTAGYRRCRPARSGSRTEQPVSTTRRPGLAALSRASWPCRPMTFCSAPSRIAQVLMTMRSASSIEADSSHPAARRRPAISSESLRFIWQPSVQTWNRGRDRTSGRYSVRRSSPGSTGDRGARGAIAPTTSTASRTGRARERGWVSVTAGPWYDEAPLAHGRNQPVLPNDVSTPSLRGRLGGTQGHMGLGREPCLCLGPLP